LDFSPTPSAKTHIYVGTSGALRCGGLRQCVPFL